jgi:hypothetical protein
LEGENTGERVVVTHDGDEIRIEAEEWVEGSMVSYHPIGVLREGSAATRSQDVSNDGCWTIFYEIVGSFISRDGDGGYSIVPVRTPYYVWNGSCEEVVCTAYHHSNSLTLLSASRLDFTGAVSIPPTGGLSSSSGGGGGSGSSGSSGNSSASSGGSSTGNTLPEGGIDILPNPVERIPLHKDLKALFKGVCRIIDPDMDKLNKAYEEMREDCFYNNIDVYIRENGMSLKNIIIDPTMFGDASINSDGNLKFRNSIYITAENLKHEWIHLFQKHYHSLTAFGDKAGMMEFELALAQDILHFVKYKGKVSEGDGAFHIWACSKTGDDEDRKNYIDWLSDITAEGKAYPSAIDNEKFQDFSTAFGRVSISYNPDRGYVYGSNATYPPSAIQALFQLAKKNCK